jgi:hypothetical protein
MCDEMVRITETRGGNGNTSRLKNKTWSTVTQAGNGIGNAKLATAFKLLWQIQRARQQALLDDA